VMRIFHFDKPVRSPKGYCKLIDTTERRAKQRQMVAVSLKTLRAYRKENGLCRECGDPLGDKDKTRCFPCKVMHSNAEQRLSKTRKNRMRRKKRGAKRVQGASGLVQLTNGESTIG
jgi:hypothetical protein